MKQKTVDEQSEKFFITVLSFLHEAKLPVLIGGTYAFSEYTGIKRDTKDLDLFCKAGDYQKILFLAKEQGFKTEITDARWLCKIIAGKDQIDLIFASASGIIPVDESWFVTARPFVLWDLAVKGMAPEELIWSKSYVGDRARYEGPDVMHLLLRCGKTLDWNRLMMRMEVHWELLLSYLILFRFVYPSERETIPKWLLTELLARTQQQFSLPTPKDKVCRGPMLSRFHYQIDIKDWGFHDIT